MKMVLTVDGALELAGAPVRAPSDVTYAMLDGIFQQCLLKHLSGDKKAIGAMQSNVRLIVRQLIEVPVPAKKRKPALAAA